MAVALKVQNRGSNHNDLYNNDGTTQTNQSGGVQGGISERNGHLF